MVDKHSPVLPARPRYITCMGREQRRTYLIREYLESRVGCKDGRESKAVRAFLVRFNAASRDADGEPVGLEIGIAQVPADRPACAIFAYIPDIGHVGWLPTIVLPHADKLREIERETAAIWEPHVVPTRSPRPRDDEGAPRRYVPPPKQEALLIPGKAR